MQGLLKCKLLVPCGTRTEHHAWVDFKQAVENVNKRRQDVALCKRHHSAWVQDFGEVAQAQSEQNPLLSAATEEDVEFSDAAAMRHDCGF